MAGFAYEVVVRGEPQGDAPLPLIVALHYSAGSAEETFENYDEVAGPVRILVPLGEHPKRGGLSYFPVDYYELGPDEQFAIATRTADRLARFLQAAEERYGSRPVVTGISQGGDLSLLLAVRYPERVAAALPIAPVVPGSLNIRSRPARGAPCILVLQGEDDSIVDVSQTRARLTELQARYPVAFKTYPGVGHDISPEMEDDYTRVIDGWLHSASGVSTSDCGI